MILSAVKLRRPITKEAQINVHTGNFFVRFGQEKTHYRSVNMSFNVPRGNIRVSLNENMILANFVIKQGIIC